MISAVNKEARNITCQNGCHITIWLQTIAEYKTLAAKTFSEIALIYLCIWHCNFACFILLWVGKLPNSCFLSHHSALYHTLLGEFIFSKFKLVHNFNCMCIKLTTKCNNYVRACHIKPFTICVQEISKLRMPFFLLISIIITTVIQ